MIRYLKVGDKIPIPLTKSAGTPWRKSLAIQYCLKHRQKFLVVTSIEFEHGVVNLAPQVGAFGETFDFHDLTLKPTDLKLITALKNISKDLHMNEKAKIQTKVKARKGRVLQS